MFILIQLATVLIQNVQDQVPSCVGLQPATDLSFQAIPVGARTRRGGKASLAQRISVRRGPEAEALDPVLRLRGEPVSFLIYLHPPARKKFTRPSLLLVRPFHQHLVM